MLPKLVEIDAIFKKKFKINQRCFVNDYEYQLLSKMR